MFDMTAKEWCNRNPHANGNIRDNAELGQLLALANMENYNSILIEQGLSQSECSEAGGLIWRYNSYIINKRIGDR